jgi:S-adenosylmethionine synthetase
MCRWVSKNIVASGIARKVEIQVAYAIGHPHPTSIYIDSFGTGIRPDSEIAKAVASVFDFRPAAIVRQLDLLRPIYRETTHYGHFTKSHLPWEAVNRADELLKKLS